MKLTSLPIPSHLPVFFHISEESTRGNASFCPPAENERSKSSPSLAPVIRNFKRTNCPHFLVYDFFYFLYSPQTNRKDAVYSRGRLVPCAREGNYVSRENRCSNSGVFTLNKEWILTCLMKPDLSISE